MEDIEKTTNNTWGNFWKIIGITNHSYYGYGYVIAMTKISDYKDWVLYYLGCGNRPALPGENEEDFYIRKLYSTTNDCFARPIDGAAGRIIKVMLRTAKMTGPYKELVVKPGAFKEALNFGSYNYLGFGGYHKIATENIKNTLRNLGEFRSGFGCEIGYSEEQKELENMLAEFLHKEKAIVVPMGYATNSTLIPILVGKGDVVFSDALNHCSIVNGIRSSKAENRIFKHNDILDLRNKLKELYTKGNKQGQMPKKVLVVVEGLYSMEGQFSKLKEIIALKKIYNFYLYVDEAHSICALGATGRGITEQLNCNFDDVDLLMGTFSKSFASCGGYIASDAKTIDLLRSNCYSFMYGNPMEPVCIQQIMSCLKLIESEEGVKRIDQLRKSSINLRSRFVEAGAHVLGDLESPVIPVLLYHPAKIADVSRICLKNGVAIVVVGFPACPNNSVRIRFCISASHTDEDIDKAFNVTINALKETGSIFGIDTPQPDVLYKPPKVDIEKDILKMEPILKPMTPLYENSDGRKIVPVPKTYEEVAKSVSDSVNLATYDFYSFNESQERINQLIKVLDIYGCGSCGPRGFYGGTTEHLNFEEKLKELYKINDAMVISLGNNTMTSMIPVYVKKDCAAVIDEYCNYPIQLGARLTRAKIFKFKHNDVDDLKKQVQEALKTVGPNKKIVIITEGVFQYDYSICPLDKIVKAKKDFNNDNIMLMLDDSLGVGCLGGEGNTLGTMNYYNLKVDEDVDIYCGSLEFIANTMGGFMLGEYTKFDKCRLFAAGYVFSASAPPYTARAGIDSFNTFAKGSMKEVMDRKKKFEEICLKSIKEKGIEYITNDKVPYIQLNWKKEGDKKKTENSNEKLCEALQNGGLYVVLQRHLEEDWCQNNYVRMNINTGFTDKLMRKFMRVISNLN